MKQTGSFDPEQYRRRLRLLRRIYGENQTQFAARVGIAFKKWNHYERGYPVPRETAFILRDRLGVSPDWIWFGVEGNLSLDLRDRIRRAERDEATASRSLQEQIYALPHSMRKKISKRDKKS